MVTEVLRPRNCLVDRIQLPSVSFHHRRKGNNGNTNTKTSAPRKSAPRCVKKVDNFKFQAENARNPPVCNEVNKKNRNRNSQGPVMGQVTILKRGECLEPKIKFGSEITNVEVDFIASGIEKMGPEPDLRTVLSPVPLSSPLRPSRKRLDIFAGSAVMSPSPNSLPLPSFFSKKQASKIVEDSATKELCRILQLE